LSELEEKQIPLFYNKKPKMQAMRFTLHQIGFAMQFNYTGNSAVIGYKNLTAKYEFAFTNTTWVTLTLILIKT
jgi:hypothetical protein